MPAPYDDLPCSLLVELVTDYLEDALEAAERRRLEAHLAECDDCALYVEQLRATIVTIGQLPRDALSEPVRARLHDAFRAYATTPPG
jgi:anti-sigma factor RsiW